MEIKYSLKKWKLDNVQYCQAFFFYIIKNDVFVDLNKTFNDPLAAKVRSILRSDYNFSRTPGRHYSVPCVYSTEQLRYPNPDGTVCASKSFAGDGVKLNCAGGFGAAMTMTATFGLVAAARAIDKIVAGARRPSERSAVVKPVQL